VVIEITESTAMADPDRTKRVLADLLTRGVRVAVDDFGTAYSSLSRLKELDIGILKIDRPFVQDVPGDPRAASMLSVIVQLARSLGVLPLAEGIERREQLEVLVQRGCLHGQGYYLSPPVPADKILELKDRPLVSGAADGGLAPALRVVGDSG
jgi:EAL domain-containing protein (putative c-di-GMP-specific phosphodiesterase class I)